MSKRTAGKTTTLTFDASTPLSTDEQAMLTRLAAMPDSDIDCSNIPPSASDVKWVRPGIRRTVIAPHGKPRD